MDIGAHIANTNKGYLQLDYVERYATVSFGKGHDMRVVKHKDLAIAMSDSFLASAEHFKYYSSHAISSVSGL